MLFQSRIRRLGSFFSRLTGELHRPTLRRLSQAASEWTSGRITGRPKALTRRARCLWRVPRPSLCLWNACREQLLRSGGVGCPSDAITSGRWMNSRYLAVFRLHHELFFRFVIHMWQPSRTRNSLLLRCVQRRRVILLSVGTSDDTWMHLVLRPDAEQFFAEVILLCLCQNCLSLNMTKNVLQRSSKVSHAYEAPATDRECVEDPVPTFTRFAVRRNRPQMKPLFEYDDDEFMRPYTGTAKITELEDSQAQSDEDAELLNYQWNKKRSH